MFNKEMKMKTVTTDKAVAREEIRTITAIASRAVKMAVQYGIDYQMMDAHMDLTFAHEQCPLRLEELLAADDANFAHDVFGIRRHMNRETCKIEDCFLPRYSR
jgi:hypothetical protein